MILSLFVNILEYIIQLKKNIIYHLKIIIMNYSQNVIYNYLNSA